MKKPLGNPRKVIIVIYFIKMDTPLSLLTYNLRCSFFSVSFGLEAPERAGSLSLPIMPWCAGLLAVWASSLSQHSPCGPESRAGAVMNVWFIAVMLLRDGRCGR